MPVPVLLVPTFMGMVVQTGVNGVPPTGKGLDNDRVGVHGGGRVAVTGEGGRVGLVGGEAVSNGELTVSI